jgi:O-antigen/teichoic acid export membrane protein
LGKDKKLNNLKSKIAKIKHHPKYNTILNWGKLISITGSSQIIVQAVGFASGILIIRFLTVAEYAFFTLGNTLLGVVLLLSDGGISAGVMAQGGKVWEDKKKLGIVVVTGLQMRKKFALVLLSIFLPISLYLLLHNGASWLTSIFILLAIIPAFFAALSDSLLEIPLKLNQIILPLQKNQITVSIGRLILVASTIFIFPLAYFMILADGASRIYGIFKIKKVTNIYADLSQMEDVLVKNEISLIVKRSLPGLIYYCFSAQISTWIISILGNNASIAQIGALGRISSVLSLVMVLFSTLIVPRFARIRNQPQKLLMYYLQIITFFVLMFLLIIGFVYLLSDQILWVLGENYQGLNAELILVIIGTTISMIMGAAIGLYVSRGWVLNYYISISSSLFPIIIGCFIFDLSTLKGVLYLNIFVAIIQMLVHVFYGYFKILKINTFNN